MRRKTNAEMWFIFICSLMAIGIGGYIMHNRIVNPLDCEVNFPKRDFEYHICVQNRMMKEKDSN